MVTKLRNTLLLLCIVAMFGRCANRDRLNPLDPENPVTGGKPTGLRIYSEFNSITIAWQRIKIGNLSGYNVYRKTAEEIDFRLIHSTHPDSNTYNNTDVTYGQYYSYRISVITPDYESPLSDSVSIIPGPTVIWVTDAYNYGIIKLSHDMHHEIMRVPVEGHPWDMAIDPHDRSIWYCDLLLGDIFHIQNNGIDVYSSLQSWWRPVSIALDNNLNIVWAADERGALVRIKPNSAQPIVEIDHYVLQQPESVSIDSRRHLCWAADPESKKVFRAFTDDTSIVALNTTFLCPTAVTVNEADGSCWVADSCRIIKLDANGNYVVTVSDDFRYASSIAVNSNNGDIWIIDWGMNYNEARVIKYDVEGHRIFSKDGFSYPTKAIVNLDDNSCIVADSQHSRLLQLSVDGEIVSENSNFYYPAGLSIEYAGN